MDGRDAEVNFTMVYTTVPVVPGDSKSIQIYPSHESKQGLKNRWFHLQKEIKPKWGDSKNEIGFDVHLHHVYEDVVVHYLGSTYDS